MRASAPGLSQTKRRGVRQRHSVTNLKKNENKSKTVFRVLHNLTSSEEL